MTFLIGMVCPAISVALYSILACAIHAGSKHEFHKGNER